MPSRSILATRAPPAHASDHSTFALQTHELRFLDSAIIIFFFVLSIFIFCSADDRRRISLHVAHVRCRSASGLLGIVHCATCLHFGSTTCLNRFFRPLVRAAYPYVLSPGGHARMGNGRGRNFRLSIFNPGSTALLKSPTFPGIPCG